MFISTITHKNLFINNKEKFLKNKQANISTTNTIINNDLMNYNQSLPIIASISFKAQNRENKRDLTSNVLNLFKEFDNKLTPDKYQIKAAESIYQGHSTIVTAPTGTGKTLIAEFALYKNLKEGKRTFYTTPLKALTNQKYKDFQKKFGVENIGIMTGDIKENTNAPIIIMTTEIYRNMLKTNLSAMPKDSLENVKTVIFDEFHYMNDADRGVVWEESIMNSPNNIQLISLSATVNNANDIRNWLEAINPTQKIDLIDVPSKERHVPLRFYEYQNIDKEKKILPITEAAINIYNLLNIEKLPERTQNALKELSEKIDKTNAQKTPMDGLNILRSIFANQNATTMTIPKLTSLLTKNYPLSEDDALQLSLLLSQVETTKVKEPAQRKKRARKIISPAERFESKIKKINDILDRLNTESNRMEINGFPAIVFLFSRKGCEIAADKYYKHILNLRKNVFETDRTDKINQINEIIEEKEKNGIVLGVSFNNKTKKRLLEGIGVHHAGMLPAHKALVEELFQKKLLDVVFATETLAAGINMPAKTTIITSFDKPGRNRTYQELTINEFQQMAGRAGRRGIDKIGHVITIPENDYESEKCEFFAKTTPNSVKSKFNVTYSDVIEILSTNNGVLDNKALNNYIERSFAVFASDSPKDKKKEFIKDFKQLMTILKDREYLTPLGSSNSYKIAPKSQILMEMKGLNELFLTELITNGTLADLSPIDLAAILSTFTDESQVYDKERNIFEELKRLKCSSNLKNKLKEILPTAKQINSLIDNVNITSLSKVAITPCLMNYTKDFINSGNSKNKNKHWNELLEKMLINNDIYFEGNFFKSLNTTLDLLNQISNVSQKILQHNLMPEKQEMFEQLLQNSKQAIKLIKISPIGDPV